MAALLKLEMKKDFLLEGCCNYSLCAALKVFFFQWCSVTGQGAMGTN